MKAMLMRQTGFVDGRSAGLEFVELPMPVPGKRQVLIRISFCGVCHTELDEIEGRLSVPRLPIVLGHQVVGRVAEQGDGATRYRVGDRVGVGWIFHSDGSEYENLSPAFRATGLDANGGYAEFMTVHEDYAFAIPDAISDYEAAPLLCAGSIGYRALRLANLKNGQPLGLTGFGGSAHIVIQLARYQYPDSPISVFARDSKERDFATELGAAWTGDASDSPPEQLQAIIDTTPAWAPVVQSLGHLRPGGRLVINAIRKQDADKEALLSLNYGQHLWMEREIKSVANITARDIQEFLILAAGIPLKPRVQIYPLQDANRALCELKRGSIRGAKVLSCQH